MIMYHYEICEVSKIFHKRSLALHSVFELESQVMLQGLAMLNSENLGRSSDCEELIFS